MIGHAWTIVVALILTPLIIGQLGIERYGVWVLVGVVTGYFGLLDFSVANVFIKYFSEHFARNEKKEINKVLNTGLVFYALLALVVIPLGFLLSGAIVNFFKIPEDLRNEAAFVFRLGLVMFIINLWFSGFKTIQYSLQRMDISNKINIAISIPMIAGTIYVLKSGFGLRGLMVNQAGVICLTGVVDTLMAYRLFSALRFNPFMFDKKTFRKIFSFGYKMHIAKISSMISWHIDKLLISYFLSVGMVTFYQLGSAIVDKCTTSVLLFMRALMPAFSEMDALNQRNKLIDGYVISTKYIALFAVPLFIFIIISASDIMMLWMGSGYERSVWVIRILGVGYLFAVLSGVRSIVLQAIARPDIEMKAGLVAALLNIPLSIFLILKMGFNGVVWGTSIALLASVVYAYIRLHRLLDLPLLNFLKDSILKIIGISVIAGLLSWFLTLNVRGLFFEPGRINSLISFFVFGILFSLTYFALLILSKPFRKKEIMLVSSYIPSFINRFMVKLSV
ncbi:MAG: polysaccharide biosynthesis C-terminal domain-containing protein [Candidatus Omnitrophica bacterium]|nr:polysaccharide biosynthesis C-terminal domain-containing protein [Candidatus Omnitrophota bacterium]